MSYVELNDTVRFGISIHNPSGGALINADETPQWYVFEDASDTPTLNGEFSKRTGLDGTYRGSFQATAANGFEHNKFYEIHASGQVNNTIGRALVFSFVLNDLYRSSLYSVSGVEPLEVSVTGIPNVNIVSVSGVQATTQGAVNSNIVGVSSEGASGVAGAVWDSQIADYISAGSFGSGVDAINQHIYYADIKLVRDETNSQDEYSVQWFKDDRPLASSDVSNPAISVYGTRNGTPVFENQTLTFASQKGTTFYDDTALRIASGEPYLVEASGLIDSSNRSWKTIVGIDVY